MKKYFIKDPQEYLLREGAKSPGFLLSWILVLLISGSAAASEDIAHTKHNLAVNPDIQAGSGAYNLNGDICVFCHTPHGGRLDVGGGAAPLWNRRLPLSSSFIPYDSPNFDKAGIQAGQPKGVSLACLSCHDGTIAFDSLINAPGSGGYFVSNKLQSGGPGVNVGLNFSGPGVDPSLKTFKPGNRTDNTAGGFIFFGSDGTTPNGNIGGTSPFPNLTADLSDDHPVGMAIPASDPQFTQILSNINIAPGGDGHAAGSGTNHVFWITRDGALQPDKRDRLRAYPSDPTNPDTPYIECASCHNPHEASRPLGQPALTDPVNPMTVNNSRFLRAPDPNRPGANMNDRNASSALCLSCHQK
ncbi:MAG: hypothetical protein HY200_04695 [Nitrospirae bacterium]|nr:hypothetical protein [Nitrospirota bacterium]